MAIPAQTAASWKPRTLAGLIDLGMVAVYVVVLGMIVAIIFPRILGTTPVWINCLLGLLFIDVPVWVWLWRQEVTSAGSLGKRVEGLRIVRHESAERESTAQATVRTAVKILPWVIVHMGVLVGNDERMGSLIALTYTIVAVVGTLGVIGLVMAYARFDHRAFHDIVAGTQVIEV